MIIGLFLSLLGIDSTDVENRHFIAEKTSQFLFEQIFCLRLTVSHFQLCPKQTGKAISYIYFFLASYKLTRVAISCIFFLGFLQGYYSFFYIFFTVRHFLKEHSLSRILRTIQIFFFPFCQREKNYSFALEVFAGLLSLLFRKIKRAPWSNDSFEKFLFVKLTRI